MPSYQNTPSAMPRQTVVQRPGDPYIYLFAGGHWYAYDPGTQPLGSGAMGTVYLGFSCETREPVAVKRVTDAYSNVPSIRLRARQEASLTFRHPNLVEMLGCCEYAPASGPIFILSRFVNGQVLDGYLHGLNLAPAEHVRTVSSYICSVLDALSYIHEQGVVHRDIKPSNLMMDLNTNSVRLMDLGIARQNGGNPYSQYGFIGTAQYAAPEQILRDEHSLEQICASTDIYATGITFYELLAGKNPFDVPQESSVLAMQMTESLPASPAIPRRLMQVIRKATEKRQADRYASAADFKAAIEEALQDRPDFFARLWRTICGKK